ncbi:MAG TPA: DEAD/DEAH box helicase [Tepidisphaeraceae bacterium]|jgi:ATP-dependent RNA helicase RhlE|nr:DEAD/DEAH box helicase [Tepidisphaeraceae bacterium]
MQFADLRLAEPILRSLVSENYLTATPVQAGAIPPALEGRDVLGCAQTGTGKTAAFALPTLHRLSTTPRANPASKGARCLVLSPTRELATQIADGFRAYGKNLQLRHTVIFGGVGQYPQVDALRRGVDIIVATPGRLMDLMNQGYVDLRSIEVFVLDEADRMLDMGFIADIRRIVAKLPQNKQTLLFSATMPTEIRRLADSLMKDPATVQIAPVAHTVDLIEQSVYHVDKKNKPQLLAHLVNELPMSRAIVFTRTKHGADRVVTHLNKAGIKAEAIHGNKSQNARQRALAGFKVGKTPVLVATDIASRGIDVDDVSHVVNYDLTHEPETYVHRIGRTGRNGAKGAAVSFCDAEERSNLRGIERLIRKQIPVKNDHPTYTAVVQVQHERSERDERPERSDRDRGGDRGHRSFGGSDRRQASSREGEGNGFGGNRSQPAAPRNHAPIPQRPPHSHAPRNVATPKFTSGRPAAGGGAGAQRTGQQKRFGAAAGPKRSGGFAKRAAR